METQSDINFRRDSSGDQNRSENQKSKKVTKNANNNHNYCHKSSKSHKSSDNTSKDKHQNKNKTQTQRERDCIQPKKTSISTKNNNSFSNDLKISSVNNKCNYNKKSKDKDNTTSTSERHKINKNKDKDNHSKTSRERDVISSNKSLNELLDNNKSLSNRETSLASNPKNSSVVVKEFKFFKEKAKDKLKKSISAATSKSSKTTNGSNTCGTTSCKQTVKSGDVFSASAVSDSCAKHKSKQNGPKESKQCRDSSTSPSGGHSLATSSANTSCDPKTIKVKTSAKNNKQLNTKYISSDNNPDISSDKKTSHLTPNKTTNQSSKSSKTKTSVVETKDNKCSKNDCKQKTKVKLIKGNPLYDEDIIDGFAILSFKTFNDIEITINGKCVQKRDKQTKDETSISPTVSSSSATSLSSQTKCSNKSNDSKNSKVNANKHSKSVSKDMKNCKNESKNSVDCVNTSNNSNNSKVTKCLKKCKQNENNGNNSNNSNNNKNNNKSVDNKDQQKPNNRLNSSKSQSLDSLSTISTVNKKTSIKDIKHFKDIKDSKDFKQHKPEVVSNNQNKVRNSDSTQDNIHEQNTSAGSTGAVDLEKSLFEDTLSISTTTTTSPSNTRHQKSSTVGLNNSSSNSSISESNKTLSTSSKRQSSGSNDSSSSTLPLIGSDGESVEPLSVDHNISSDLNNDSESESSTTCSSSKAPIIKSNRVLTSTPPPLPALKIPSILLGTNSGAIPIPVQSPSQQLCGSDSNKPIAIDVESSAPSDPIVIETKDKVLNGSERTERIFPSHFIESVLRNTSPSEPLNTQNNDDRAVVHTNHSLSSSPPLTNKIENNNKENSNFLTKVSKPLKTTSTSAQVSNCVKTGNKDTNSLSVKRKASPLPVPTNQSTAAKHIRHSSPNNQIKNFDSINSGLHSSASTHSIRSTSSSLSSLSQLSQSIGQTFNTSKERDKDREEVSSVGTNSNKSVNSRSTPSIVVSNSSPDNTFSVNYTKSHLWSATSSSTGLNGSSVPHLSSPSLATRPTTPSIGLTSSLHNNPLGMFASPIPPVSLPSVGGAVAPSATPSPFIGDSLFSQQNPSDFLRRELDTRFLASQDRTINIPPPPYMRSEMHQHIHLPQSQPYPLTQGMSSPLVPPTNPHLYEKYPKLDQTFYGRNALTLPGFPSLSPLLTPGSTSSTPQSAGLTSSSSTPFGAPAHLAAFQPKLNSLSSKPKPSAKSGRWCAMHVRIAWEIYHHQQKQQMELTHKSGVPSVPNSQSKSGSSDHLLRPLNHLFSLGRTQDLPPFSSALMNAASSRTPFDSGMPSHHNQFGSTPVSPHLSSQTTNFSRFPTFGNFGSLGSSLSLPHVTGPPTTLFGPTAISGNRDLPIPGCLPGLSASGPDMWARNASTRPTSALFPPLTASTSSTSSSSSSWGGLKAEAERNRITDDLYLKRKHSDNSDKESKRFERENKYKIDDKNDSKHKDLTHSQPHSQSHNQSHTQPHNHSHSQSHKHNSSTSSAHVRNGDIYSEYKKDWLKNNAKRDSSRSPVHHSHHSSHSHSSHHTHRHSHIHSYTSPKTTIADMSAFDNNNRLSSVGVKDEQKDENERERERHHRFDTNDMKVRTSSVPTIATSSASNLMNSSSTLAAMSLNNPLEKARLMGLFGLHGTPPPVSPHYSANNTNDPLRSYWNPLLPTVDPFKSLHELQVRPDFLERDNIFQRYSLLNSAGGGAPIMDRIAKESAEKEMLNQSIEKHNSKQFASHLRSNDMSFTSGLPTGHNHNPHTSTPSSSNHFPANPYLNSLHSLSASAGSYVKNNKTTTAAQSSSSSSSSEPSSPSMAPTNGILPALIPNVLNHSNITNSKLSIGSLIESPLESIKDMNKKSETIGSPVTPVTPLMSSNGNKCDVILESNSR